MEEWPPPATDAFPMTTYDERHHLDVALNDAGYELSDLQAIVVGHMHLDHAGGLEKFVGTDVPVYVHELEMKEQWYQVASWQGGGVYVPGDLHLNLNW